MDFNFYKLGKVLATADGGCSVCVSSLITETNEAFELTPEQLAEVLRGANEHPSTYSKFYWNKENNECDSE